MSTQFKSFSWSFAIHALIFISIFGIGRYMPNSNPIVIDFSIEDSAGQMDKTIKETPTKKEASAYRKTAPSQAINKQDAIKHEEKTYETPPLQEAVSENQAPLTPTVSAKDTGYKEAAHINPQVHGGSDRVSGNAKEISNVSGDSAVDSLEKAKARYQKEHFAYIRDKIMNSLSYPLMAKKMGWSGKVTLSFIVCENGSVENIKIVESSSIGILDKNAVETIKKILPLPIPPVRAEIIIPVVYRLN
ncbi:MAG: energy transducer TonB [Nitrospirae bacterium]|nr:energy transducer TonB [Nitrospirota bacterium]